MESLWCVHCHWRKIGRSYFPHQAVVYLHLIHDAWLAAYNLYDIGFLDEHEAVHMA